MSRKTSKIKKGNFYCGTSNIILPVPNKAFFPEEFQEKSRLCYYGSLFNSLEVNSSFYKIPMPKTVAKWAAEVPGNFMISFKLWKGISHTRDLVFLESDLDRFFQSVNEIGNKKGSILVQFPAGVKFSLFQKMSGLFNAIALKNEEANWHIAVEFRDKGWYRDETFELLEQNKFSLVLHDMPASSILSTPLESQSIYLRFHGENGDYRGGYSNDFLDEYASLINEWIREGKDVFCYFNNSLGEAYNNAKTLQQLVSI